MLVTRGPKRKRRILWTPTREGVTEHKAEILIDAGSSRLCSLIKCNRRVNQLYAFGFLI